MTNQTPTKDIIAKILKVELEAPGEHEHRLRCLL